MEATGEKKPARGGLVDRLVFSGAVWAVASWLTAPHQWLRHRRMGVIFGDRKDVHYGEAVIPKCSKKPGDLLDKAV